MSKANYKLLYMQLKEALYRDAKKLHIMAVETDKYEYAMRYAFAEDIVNDLYVKACEMEDK